MKPRLTASVLVEGDLLGGGECGGFGELNIRISFRPERDSWEWDGASADYAGEEVGGHMCVHVHVHAF